MKLRIRGTSRERRGIVGETVRRVPSLPRPEAQLSAAQIEHSEAVQLFVERAQAVLPALDLQQQILRMVADICRKLAGIPLALKLAAAHVSLTLRRTDRHTPG